MPTALKITLAAVEKRRAEAAADYEALVRDLADGKSADPESVIATVADADKTFGELEADVERVVSRRDAARTLAGRDRALAVRDRASAALVATTADADTELDAALARLEQARLAAIAARDKRIATARAVLDAAAEQVRDCEAARIALVDTAPAPIAERLEALRREQLALVEAARRKGDQSRVTDRLGEIEREIAELEIQALTP